MGLFSGIASLVGGFLGADASEDAANIQAGASREATAEQRRQYDQTRKDLLPYYQTGTGGNAQLAYFLGINPGNVEGGNANIYDSVNKDLGAYGSLSKPFTMADYQADPGYAFRLSEGQKALERSAAARGMTNSGAALKAAQAYGQDLASQEFNNAYNRYNTNQTNLYNRLAGISGTGQNSANTIANVGQNTANQISSNIIGAGNAQAAGTIGAANAWSTGLNNAINAFGGGGNTPINTWGGGTTSPWGGVWNG